MRRAAVLATLAIGWGVGPAPAAADSGTGLVVEGAWVRWTPRMIPSLAYFRLENRGVETVSLTGARSDRYARVEFHAAPDGGVFMMEDLDLPLRLAPGDAIVFAPGGPHLALFTPSGWVNPDDVVTIQLQLDDGRSFAVECVVSDMLGRPAMQRRPPDSPGTD